LIAFNQFRVRVVCAEVLIDHIDEAFIGIRYVVAFFLGVDVGLKPDL